MLAIRADASEGTTLRSVPSGGEATHVINPGEDCRLIVSSSVHFRVTVTALHHPEWEPVTALALPYTQVEMVLPGQKRYAVAVSNRDASLAADMHVAVLRGKYGG